ncbi:MAG TPA: hypothetical protein PLO67_07685 [Saprospiraceae bacterium]|nr:hypothetical protein [Saprospiraceae bacterium]
MNENSNSLNQEVVKGEISAKYTAIHAYDKIIWQVRTGFLTLVFGGWAFIIKGAVENGMPINAIKFYILMMVFLSLILALCGYLVDKNYVRRKYRVVNSLTRLIAIYSPNSENEFTKELKDEIKLHLGIVGESGNSNYLGDGYDEEIDVSNIIYLSVGAGCIALLSIIIWENY